MNIFKQKTEALNITSKLVGLQINTKKTKIMAINNRCKPIIKIQNEEIENVEEFTYLGSIVDKNGGTEKDIKSRISKAQIAFQSLHKIWQLNNLSLTKLRLFNTNVKSALLYGAEMWKTTKNLINKIQAFINRCLRRILKIHWPEKISNEELYRKTNQELVKKTVKYHKWSWIGHTCRKPDEDISRQLLEWNPQGKRRKGRPRNTWRQSVEQEMDRLGKDWKNIKTDARNRVRWKKVVEALCSSK
jgi:hypothetical protein